MAGIGRNVNVLKKKFHKVECLDGSVGMLEKCPTDVVKHLSMIQDFDFPKKKYDSIVGVFCLCYLASNEIESVLVKMEQSLKDYGFIILLEPVLAVGDHQTERVHPDTEQRMMVRSAKYYTRLFAKLQISVHKQKRFEIKASLTDPLMAFVLKDGTLDFY